MLNQTRSFRWKIFFVSALFFWKYGLCLDENDPIQNIEFKFYKTKRIEALLKKNEPDFSCLNKSSSELNLRMKSIFPFNKTMTFFLENGEIVESTFAEYRTSTPIPCYKKIDFKLLVASNFGCRAYLFDYDGTIQKEWGDESSSYWGASYCPKQNLMVLANSNLSKIEIVDSMTLETLHEITGYVSTAVFIAEGDIYFTAEKQRPGADNGTHYQEHALYKFNIYKQKIDCLTSENLWAPRGVCVYKKWILVSDTFQNNIKFFNKKTYKVDKIYSGFLMQNNLHLSGDFLFVGDEHNQCIRVIDLTRDLELYATPMGYLLNPAHAHTIDSGLYSGQWVVTDTEHDRILLFDPQNNKSRVMIHNLRTPMVVIPIFNLKN